MRLPHRYQAPEPGEPGTGESPASPAIEAPAETTLANHPEPEPSAEPEATPGKPAAQVDNAAKIDALLDTIGKEDKPKAPEPRAEDPPKPADPKALDLTPPEGINDRSKTRWTALAEQAKQVPVLEERATKAETQLAGVRELVAQSGLAADEFQGMLAMGRLYKSTDPGELQQALQQLDGLRADLATRLGVDTPGVDVLAKHPDLQAEVDAMGISRERALEIVRLRNAEATNTASTQEQRGLQQFQAGVQQAATEMDDILAQRASAPGHVAKVDHIKAYFADPAKLQSFVTTYQPSQWKAAVLMMYDSYSPPAPAVPAVPQPLRPGNMASGHRQSGNKQVSSTAAVENAWGAIGL